MCVSISSLLDGCDADIRRAVPETGGTHYSQPTGTCKKSHHCCCSAEVVLAVVDAAAELDAGSAAAPPEALEEMVEPGSLGFLGLDLPC